MKPTTLTDTTMQTPPPKREAMAALRRCLHRWRAGIVGAVGLLAVGLAVPPPAAACDWYNPVCWAEEVVDYFADYLNDIENLARDVFNLDPAGAFHDLVDIGENFVCGGKLTVLDLIGGNVAEALRNDNCDPPHPIEPAVLAKLGPYFNSSFTSVVIHQNCHFSGANATTFGEHIYFATPDHHLGYHPLNADGTVHAKGFSQLAHELTHVLQYRREGFADFICHYWPTCGAWAFVTGGTTGVSCGEEQEAYMEEALVREDVARDGDGVFTCDLAQQEWNGDNVGSHNCTGKPLKDNCPDTFNPDQTDSNHDGQGDACQPGHQCTPGATRHDRCPVHFTGIGYDYTCSQYGYWHQTGGWCKHIPPGGLEQ